MATPKIYTKAGDNGWTDLANGQRVEKDALVIEVDGTLDELNALLGVLLAFLPEDDRLFFQQVQRHLFGISSWVAGGKGEKYLPTAADVAVLETWIDTTSKIVGSLFTGFVLLGGAPAAAQAQVARTVCRRAERRLLTYLRTLGVWDTARHNSVDGEEDMSETNGRKGEKQPLCKDDIQKARWLLTYLNRLSDTLYACAKKINFLNGVKENQL